MKLSAHRAGLPGKVITFYCRLSSPLTRQGIQPTFLQKAEDKNEGVQRDGETI